MKKFVAGFLILISILLCSCTTDTSGTVYELTSEKWQAKLEGGAVMTLEFSGDTASLKVSNADKSSDISGKYIADDKSFIIFMPAISQNYEFEYVPKGKKLELSYGNNAVIFEKVT